jgi:Trk-type K+ transport system membrane component
MVKTSSVPVTAFAALALSLLNPGGAAAGTISIFDNTEVITQSNDLGARVSGFACVAAEVCAFDLLGLGPGVASVTVATVGVTNGILLENGSQLISDMVQFPSVSTDRISFVFSSDNELGNLGSCSFCTVFEDGTLQPLVTVTYRNAAGATLSTETIQVQSDAVPEPSTMVLMLVGWVGLVTRGRWAFRRV